MRNLKRALSLTLASVMLLGMMVVGAGAASYPDVDDSDNVEAIEVLQAVKVMVGDENGNFGPEQPVNRSQMAVVMALLLDLDYDYYQGTCPFWDVPSWAEPYVAACYANGIVSGYNAYEYGAADPVTAVQAASMMMRALGYFKFASDYADGFELSTVRQASKINLFDQIGANATDPLTRNQVAQLALNTLKTPIVEAKDNTINISSTSGDANVTVTGGQVDYVVVASKQAYAQTIDRIEQSGDGLNQVTGYTVELGEQLYKGNLQLNDNAEDDFGRPARYWEYNGKAIGTYYKKELLVKEYVGQVTGKDLYDQLGAAIIKDYHLSVAIDGVSAGSADAAAAGVFGAEYMDKNNKDTVGRTGTGTLTQVFVDNSNAAVNKDGRIYIAIINTYLAKASQDYDTKKEELNVTIYGAYRNTATGNYVKDSAKDPAVKDGKGSSISSVGLAVEDLPMVQNMSNGDFLLVTAASGEVKTAVAPEILSSVKVSGFKVNSDVVVDGTTYNFTTTAHYKDSDLKYYTGDNNGTVNLQDTTYNVYLDLYGNLIGVEEVNPVKNYVFITGTDRSSSNYTNKTAKALGLFVDGTDEEITYRTDKGTPPGEGLNNVWCTYTKDTSGVYTLRVVADAIDADGDGAKDAGVELAQFNTQDGTGIDYNSNNFSIDSKNSTLNTKTASTNDGIIYGKADTVYLIADLDRLTKTTEVGKTIFGAVKGTDTPVVDVKNADIKVWSKDIAKTKYSDYTTLNDWSYGVYALYNDNYGIVAAVVIGEDNGTSKKWYNTGNEDMLHEDYEDASTEARATYVNGEWVWTRTLFDENGNAVTLTERGDSASYLKNMNKNQDYLIKLDAKGEVYRAYRLPTDTEGTVTELETVAEAGVIEYKAGDPDKTNSDAEFVTDPDLIGEAVMSGKGQMLVSCEVLNNKMNVSQNGLLYATNRTDSGILTDDNTKIILIQYNRNAKDTYTDGVGFNDLKNIINGLNQDHENGNYDYKISAVLENRVAKSIIIYDRTSDWSAGTGDTSGTTGPLNSNGVTLVTDSSVKANNFAAVISSNTLNYQFYTDMGAAADTDYTYDWELKNADNVSIGRGTGATSTDVPGDNMFKGSIINSQIVDGKAYTLTITNVVPTKYKLTAASEVSGIDADDITLNSGVDNLTSAGTHTLNLAIAQAKVTATEKVNVSFTVTGVDTSTSGLGGGVTGSNGSYVLNNVTPANLSTGVDVLSGVKATGEVVVTVTGVEDASATVAVSVVFADEASASYAQITGTLTNTTVSKGATTVSLVGLTLAARAPVTKLDYVLQTAGQSDTAAQDLSSHALNTNTSVAINPATPGTPVVIKVKVTPTEFTATNLEFIGESSTQVSLKFDKDGWLVDGQELITTGLNAGDHYRVTIGDTTRDFTLGAGVSKLAVGANQFKVNIAELVSGERIQITIRQMHQITGPDGSESFVEDGRDFTVLESWETYGGTGVMTDDGNGNKDYCAYGDDISAVSSDLTLTGGYVKVTVVDGTDGSSMSNDWEVKTTENQTEITAVGYTFVKVGSTVTVKATGSSGDDVKITGVSGVAVESLPITLVAGETDGTEKKDIEAEAKDIIITLIDG